MKKRLLTVISGVMAVTLCLGVYAAPETETAAETAELVETETETTAKAETAAETEAKPETETESETEEDTPEYYFEVELVEPYAKEDVKYFGNSIVSVNDNGKLTELDVKKDVQWDGKLDKKNCFKEGETYTAVITFEADVEKILGIEEVDLDDFGITMPDYFEFVNLEEKEDNLWEVTLSLPVKKMPVSKDKKHKHDKPLPENKIGKKEATCETEGFQIYDCQCGYREIKDIKALGHNMQDNGSVAASCDKDGAKKEICSRCGMTTEEVIKATGHNWKLQNTDKATCDKDGADHYKCANCGKTKDDAIKATGHKWEYWYKEEPGCDYNGADVYKCANCGQSKEDGIYYAYGHDWVNVASKPALCETDGEQIYECNHCHKEYTEYIPATGHDWYQAGGGAASCEFPGTRWYLCANYGCDAEYTEYDPPAMGHDTYTWYDGLNHGWACSRCTESEITGIHDIVVNEYEDFFEYYCWCGYYYTIPKTP